MALKFSLSTTWNMRYDGGSSNVRYDWVTRYNCPDWKIATPESLGASYAADGIYFKIPCSPNPALSVNIIVGAEIIREVSGKQEHDYSEIEECKGIVDASAGYYTTQQFVSGARLGAYLDGWDRGLVLNYVSSSVNPVLIVSYTMTNPLTVSNIKADTTVTDGAISLTWETQMQHAYAVQIISPSGAIVYETESAVSQDETAQGCAIPARTLANGAYTVRVCTAFRFGRYAHTDLNGNYPGMLSQWAETVILFRRVHAEIISFEPNGVPQNRENAIPVYWTSDNQHAYKLVVRQAGAAVLDYAGTTETAIAIPANALQSGMTELELTLKYIPTWGTEVDAVYTTKMISFDAYGTPQLPVFTSPEVLATAFPMITWTSTEQYVYRLKVLAAGAPVLDTGDVQSADPFCAITQPLDNGTYTLQLQTFNEYGFFSDVAEQVITVQFTRPALPILTVNGNASDGSIHITIVNPPGGVPVDHCDLFRREAINLVWTRIARDVLPNGGYVDFAVASDCIYLYKARAIGAQGGYGDGDAYPAQVTVRGTRLSDSRFPADAIVLQLEPEKSESPKKGVYPMQYSGLPAPKVEYSDERYSTLDATFFVANAIKEQFVSLYYNAPLLLLRDNRGRKLFGFVEAEPTIRDAAPGYSKVSFTFTETDYTEAV